jgi:hypothetical protein
MSAVSRDTEYAAGSRRQFLHLAVHQFRADRRCFPATRGACSGHSPSRSCFS